ncbi:hypothetical protein KQ944_18280 [Bacillus subtilis]|uniref:hypothetical protein n=1 Tax=Pseudochrobactrum asaccharolyticum TaxID=354351 RepID=UPI001F3B81CA|nr:hypothetical protein [Pseudochrobactrum asaccharolyticum]MCF7647297.1 hypothetical protein [Pseudochrobactrum asaccharolyticum]MCF7673588.1 hypothetical protein [Bacillus subtilis]
MLESINLNLTNKEMDQFIYRIVKADYVFDLFKNNQNTISQIHNWKDKFENLQLSLGGILDGKRFDYAFKDNFSGQCWSTQYSSEAMWGIYANDPTQRYLRIRSTPRKLISALAYEHPSMPQLTCFIGKVSYMKENELKDFVKNNGTLAINTRRFAESLLLKRKAFSHECEVRLLYFGDRTDYDHKGLYRYKINPHMMITQIMADPNIDRAKWSTYKNEIQKKTGFEGEIKRSKIYDAPDWADLIFTSPKN